MSRRVVLALLAALAPASAGAQVFTDAWGAAGFAREASQGVALGDFDADGRPDVLLTGTFLDNPLPFLPDFGAPNGCWRNLGAARFQDVAPAVGLAQADQCFGAAWSDFDNDGRLDLHVVRGLQVALPLPHLLYRQRNDGTFDSSPSADVASATAGRSVCWADYDADGYLDLFVTNGLDSGLLPDASVRLFRNDRRGGFVDVTARTGVRDLRNAHGCAWSDYDNDGDVDLFVANHGFEDPLLGLSDPQPDALFRNLRAETGSATFVDVAPEAGVDGLGGLLPGQEGASASFGCAWGDFDNDGWMDLFVTTGFAGVVPLPTPNRFYRNNGDGTFADRTLAVVDADFEEPSFGVTLGDYDNDGDLDAHVSNAAIPGIADATNDLLVNQGFPFYVLLNEEASTGVGVSAWSQACASADFDGDGDLDIYATDGTPGAELLQPRSDHLWLNGGNANHWLHLDLVGVASNRSAVGARLDLRSGLRRQTREVAAGSGYQSMDDLRVEFGLGPSTRADRIEIRWPSGCVQVLTNVAADQVLEVVEPCLPPPGWILRGAWEDPLAPVFPLLTYQPAPAAPAWTDPQPVVGDGRLLYYEHDDAALTLRARKAGASVELTW